MDDTADDAALVAHEDPADIVGHAPHGPQQLAGRAPTPGTMFLAAEVLVVDWRPANPLHALDVTELFVGEAIAREVHQSAPPMVRIGVSDAGDEISVGTRRHPYPLGEHISASMRSGELRRHPRRTPGGRRELADAVRGMVG